MTRHERIKEEIEIGNGWFTIGYEYETGRPIQRNVNTKEIRKLDKWVEIFRTPIKEAS